MYLFRKTPSRFVAGSLGILAFVSAYDPAFAENRAVRRAAPGQPRTAAPAPVAPAAPTKEELVDLGALLSRSYEDRARALLERYIPSKEFQLTASAVSSGKQLKRAPYEPRSVTSASIATLPAEALRTYAARVSFDIALSSRVAGNRRKIEELLVRSLKLDAARGDRMAFGSLGLDIEDESWTKEKTDLKQELALIRSERDKLNRELSVVAQQLRAQEKEIERERERSREIAREGKSTGNAEKEVPPFQEYLPYIWMSGAAALLLIMFTGVFVFGRSVSSAGRNLGGAIAAIAQSLETASGALSGPRDSNGQALRPLEAKMISEGRMTGNTTLASLPIDAIHSHIVKVRKEIQDHLTDATEAIILRYISQLCANPQNIGRAVVAMEVLGRDVATDLFRRLSFPAQEAVLLFLREGIYDKNKIELMLEAAEELKTKLLVESFDNARGKPSEKVAQKLIQVSDDDLGLAALEIAPEMLPRLFLYLDSSKIARILNTLKRINVGHFEKAVAVLGKMPDVEAMHEFDTDIIRALDAVLDKANSDSQRPFLKIYQEILEKSDDEVGESILRELSTDKRLDEFLRENVINIHTFFRLNEDTRSEMLETFSNKDIAALAYGVDETEREQVFEVLSARRAGLIREEYDTLVSRGGRGTDEAFRKVRDTLIGKLKEMKNKGTLVGQLTALAPTAPTPSPSTPFRGGTASGDGTVVGEVQQFENDSDENSDDLDDTDEAE